MSRHINIKVSSDFNLPDLYTSDQIEDIEEALWIGATIQQSVRAYRSDSAVLNIKELSQKEIANLKQFAADREQKLKLQIQELETEIRILHSDHSVALKQARSETSESVRYELNDKIRSIESNLKAAEDRRRFLEETCQEDIRKATERERITMERIISEKEKEIGRLDMSLKMFQEIIAKQTEEISKLGTAVSKKVAAATNVKLKGSNFENEFCDLLSTAYSTIRDFEIKNTARGAGHEADFITNMESGEQVMWELKDYSGIVPRSEVDKFLRDMKGARGVRIGVMISKSTDIIGKHGPLVVDHNEGNLLVYVNQFDNCWNDDGNGGGLFQILLQLFRFWWKIGKRVHNDESTGDDEVDSIKLRIDEGLKNIQKQIEDLKNKKTQWRTHKARNDEMIRWMAEFIEDSQIRLDRLIKVLQGSVADSPMNTIHCETKSLPRSPILGGLSAGAGGVAKYSQLFLPGLDEKQKEWVEEIMKICVYGVLSDEEDYVKIATLVDKLSENHRMSKDTIRSQINELFKEERIEKRGSSKVVRGLKIL